MKRIIILISILALALCGCKSASTSAPQTQIQLSDNGITVDGKAISQDSSQAVYAANDIVFYLEGQDFTYGEGSAEDAHSQEEADAHTVVHITKPGHYMLSGKLSLGQIAVDLGEDAKDDPSAQVTLILNGVDITCQVAPAIIFYNVYECGSDDEDTATKDVDTLAAGANVVIADNSENTVNGAYVAKIYKSYELNEAGTEVVDSKKLHKYDGAFYSKRTMNIFGGELGNGILNINAENEGLDSELHLTLWGGNINIVSGNDGINTNEDNVSITTINGGKLNILVTGTTGEGDGIDSNGWLVINGGTVISQACGFSADAGIDSDKGIYIEGGKVMATGNMLDRIAGGYQSYSVFTFAQRQTGDSTYTLKNLDGATIAEYEVINPFTYLIVSSPDLKPGDYTFWQGDTQLKGAQSGMDQGGMGGRPGGTPPQFSEGGKQPGGQDFGNPPEMPGFSQRPELPQGQQPQEQPQFPQGQFPEGGFPDKRPTEEMTGGDLSTTFTPVRRISAL